MKTRMLIASMIALVVFGTSFAVEGPSLDGVKCLYNPKAAVKADQTADWKEGKVYFCCGSCKGKFEKLSKDDKEKMAAQANAQLVSTKQYEQKACPMTGGAVKADSPNVEVAGTKVSFCCNNCKGKAEKMKDEEKVTELFGEKAFKNGKFAKVEVKK